MKIVDIEYTPNPNAVKFILQEPLTSLGITRTVSTKEEAEAIPLAAALFEIEHVISVYFAGTWLTVTQNGEAEWRPLLKQIAVPIRAAEPPEIAGNGSEADLEDMPGLDDPRVAEINEVLDEQIRPYLEFDGGGVVVRGLVDNKVYIKYQGACGTCPSSSMGTMMAIEGAIQREVDEELEVVIL